jgi:hypothetical protein
MKREHASKMKRCRRLTAALAFGLVFTLWIPIVWADKLYIGDAGDDSVKQFDASNDFAFQGAFVKSQAGLKGPRGLIFDSGNLLISDQNVSTSSSGDILEFGPGKTLLARIVSNSDPNAPPQPRGMILTGNSLFVASFSDTKQSNQVQIPGTLLQYTAAGQFVGAFAPPTGALPNSGEFHPRGVVLGPDGLLYVSNFPNLQTQTGGQILRFYRTGGFKDIFVTSSGGPTCSCTNELNRPEGLVFGPDGNLYITSFRASDSDTDKILVFQGPHSRRPGAYVNHIVLDAPTPGQAGPRSFAQALLFGPGGRLFVPITGNGPDTGSVRSYDVSADTFTYSVVVPSHADGGPLESGWYLTFGSTDPATLAYQQ